MMLPVSRYVSPDKTRSSFYRKHCVAAKVIYLAIFVAKQPLKWHRGNYLKEVLNSKYVEVCWYMRRTKVVQDSFYLVIVTNS